MKLTSPYTLPELSIIGGSSQRLVFDVFHGDSGNHFDLDGCDVFFSLINYVNKTGAPIISKSVDKISEDDSDCHTISVTLTPSETVDCVGKFIYQITINDEYGNSDQMQGVIYIHKNIDKSRINS
jgi:hypothetical protein